MLMQYLPRLSCSVTSLTRQLLPPRRVQPFQLRMASTWPDLPIFRALASHYPENIAVGHSASCRRFSYDQLLSDVDTAKARLYQQLKSVAATKDEPIGGQRVAFLVENGYNYVGSLVIDLIE